MQESRGQLEISGPQGTTHYDTLTCCHCNNVVTLGTGSERPGSTCLSCMRFQCAACAAKPCRPFEAWLDLVERPTRAVSAAAVPGGRPRTAELFRVQPLGEALPREQCCALRSVLIDRQSGRSCALLWDEGMATRLQAEMNRAAGGERYEQRTLTLLSEEQLRLMEAARFSVLNPMAQRALALCWDPQAAQQIARLLNTTLQTAALRALA